jgi:hypothetical protein
MHQCRPQAGGSSTLDLGLAPSGLSRPPVTGMENAHGHHLQQTPRDVGGGILGSHPPPPVTGMNLSYDLLDFDASMGSRDHSTLILKMEFPKFDGNNLRLWRDQCEMFFEVYSMVENLKTRFAALNFIGPAATWRQTLERRGRILNWEVLCREVFQCFDKDQYSMHLRQLDSLWQRGSVSDYVHTFEQLAHGILLYNSNYDDTYFVTRFLGVLKEEIHAPIVLHRPRDVATASVLALLQEEELNLVKTRAMTKEYNRGHYRTGKENDKPKDGSMEVNKIKVDRTERSDKLEALRNYRRKNGLCFKCGEKWGQQHKCPTQILLHVLEKS